MTEEGEAPVSNWVHEGNSTADNAVTEDPAQVPSQMHDETSVKETAGAHPVELNAEKPLIGSKDVKEGNAEKLRDNEEVNAEGKTLAEEEQSGEGQELDEEVSGEEASEESDDVEGEQNTEAETIITMPEEGEAPISNLVHEENSTADNVVTEVSAQVPSQMHGETSVKETAGADPVELNAEKPLIGSKDIKEINAEKLPDNEEVNAEGKALAEEEESGEGEELDEEEVSGEEASEESDDLGGEQNTEAEASHQNGMREYSERNVNKTTKGSRKRMVADKSDAGKPRPSKKQKSSNDADKVGSSKKQKSSKKFKSMGMIFMCSSRTKDDCFHYKVLGLPASKKEMVLKVYKGMRLLMYGIYKAAGPGGYNLEPKAFKSAFPSQVHFTISEDCLPVAEEKFKKVIEDNYYTRNKFHCQLTAEQVKNLCKLFQSSGRAPKSKPIGASRRVGQRETRGSLRQEPDEVRPTYLIGNQLYTRVSDMYGREVPPPRVAPPPVVPLSQRVAPAISPRSYVPERTLDIGIPRSTHIERHDPQTLYLDRSHPRRFNMAIRTSPGSTSSLYMGDPVYAASLPSESESARVELRPLYSDPVYYAASLPSESEPARVMQRSLYRDPVYAASLPSESEPAIVVQRPLFRDPVYAASLPSESEPTRVMQRPLYRDPVYAASLTSQSESARVPPLEFPPVQY
ncbi:Development/cell death domain, partial [Dillenia turbinata]